MSRQAKLLMNNRPGRTASYGMVLEELMNSRGQSTGFLSGKDESPQKKSLNNSPIAKVAATNVATSINIAQEQSPPTIAMAMDAISASRSSEF